MNYKTILLALWIGSAAVLQAQTKTIIRGSGNEIQGTITVTSTGTLGINGTLSGTPTGGTVDWSALSFDGSLSFPSPITYNSVPAKLSIQSSTGNGIVIATTGSGGIPLVAISGTGLRATKLIQQTVTATEPALIIYRASEAASTEPLIRLMDPAGTAELIHADNFSVSASGAVVCGAVTIGGTAVTPSDYALKSYNLSDLTNVATARTNLGLGTSATLDVGTTANKVVQLTAAGKLPAVDGSLLTNLPSSGHLVATNNLSDLASVSTARTNLGLGTSATLDVGTTANKVVQLTAAGKLPAVDGSLLTNLPSGSGLVAANNLSDVANAATARTNLGLGTGNSPTFTGLTLSSGNAVLNGANNTAPAHVGAVPAPGTIIVLDQLQSASWFGAVHRYNNPAGSTLLTVQTAIGPMCTGRMDSTYTNGWGGVGSNSNIAFIPFYVSQSRTLTSAVMSHLSGTHPSATCQGAIYTPDSQGLPKTRVANWTWPLNATGVKTATFTGVSVQGLIWVAVHCSLGAGDYAAGSTGGAMALAGVGDTGWELAAGTLFGYYKTMPFYSSTAWISTASVASLPADLSSPAILISSGHSTLPVILLY